MKKTCKIQITEAGFKFLFLLCFIFSANMLAAQSDSTNIQHVKAITNSKTVQPYDVKDLFKKHKKQQKVDNIKQKKIQTALVPAAGYSLQTGLAAALNAEIAFYSDSSSQKRVSSILTSITYTQYNQFLFPLAANIWAGKNKYNILIDYRFLKYPSTTYGIGARTTENDAYTLNFNYIKFHQTILKKFYKELYGGIGFYYDYFWNITEVSPPTGVKTSFQKYGSSNKEVAAAIVFRLQYDNRENPTNATRGSYFNIVFRPNYTFLGSGNNWKSLQVEYRKYLKPFRNSKNILALWSYNWFTLGKQKPPYLLLPGTGWDDQYNTGRGYIQSRFRAKDMIYAEAEYRFGISKNGLLGAVIFANAQSFSKNFSNQLTVISPGVGAGLRIKFNKYSNTNLCIDYGFGLNGSKGLFLNLGEVF